MVLERLNIICLLNPKAELISYLHLLLRPLFYQKKSFEIPFNIFAIQKLELKPKFWNSVVKFIQDNKKLSVLLDWITKYYYSRYVLAPLFQIQPLCNAVVRWKKVNSDWVTCFITLAMLILKRLLRHIITTSFLTLTPFLQLD